MGGSGHYNAEVGRTLRRTAHVMLQKFPKQTKTKGKQMLLIFDQISYCAWPVVTPTSLNQDWLLGSSWQPDCWLIRASQGYQCCSWLMIRARPASLARISAQDVDKDHQHYSRFYNRSVLINGEITPGSRWRSWRMPQLYFTNTYFSTCTEYMSKLLR